MQAAEKSLKFRTSGVPSTVEFKRRSYYNIDI